MAKSPVEYTLEWNEEDIRRFAELAKSVFARATNLLAHEVWGNISRESPTDQGRLAGSFMIEPIDEYNWRIYTNVEYALFVHEGTGVYGPMGQRIVPVQAKALVFTWQGKTWFLSSVAGQKPNPYADRAIQAADSRTDEFIARALRETTGGEAA